MHRAEGDRRAFNVVVTCAPGRALQAIHGLRRLGVFRSTPYRAVLIGAVDGDAAHAVREAWAVEPSTFAHVVRVIPLERVTPFVREDVTERLCSELAGAGARVAGRSFHVRVRLRGLAGKLESHAVERALGAFLLELADAQECAARVTFKDADLVLAVEVIGKRVGYGFLDRDARAVPLVRVR